jgi:hypothetical protein
MASIARGAFLLLVAGAAAQDKPVPKPAELAVDLASDTAVTVAWAASHAANAPSKELIAPLRKALHAWSEREGDEAEVTRLHLLDALLQSGAKVPASELLLLLKGERAGTVAFVLLVREPKLNERELLELFRASPHVIDDREFLSDAALRTLALGNTLAAQRTPGFATFVWQQLDLDLHVIVTDGGNLTSSVSFALPNLRPPAPQQGFPPEPIYRLVTEAGAGTQWLTSGQTPVGFVRALTDEQRAWRMPGGHSAQWISWLRVTPMDLQSSDTGLTIGFKSRGSYLEAVGAARRQLVEHKKAALRALVAAGAMTEAEALAAASSTEVQVDDQRTNRAEALPDIPPIK